MKAANRRAVFVGGGVVLAFLLLLSIRPAVGLAPTSGSIGGTVKYWGQESGNLEIFVDAHLVPNQPPVAVIHVPSPGGGFTFADMPDGTYYLGAWLDVDGSGDGPPGPGEPHVYYDLDRDGDPDPVVVSGGNVTGIDLDIAEILVAREGIDQADCGIQPTPPCYSLEYALTHRVLAGDTILALSGIYTEAIAMQPGVVIAAQAGPGATFIDGGGVRGPMVTAGNAAIDRATRLEGFTIQGGSASSASGAGLTVFGASPTISDCLFVDNSAQNGAAISIAFASSDVLIQNSHVVSNTAALNGGGIQVGGGRLELVGSEVSGNSAGSWAGGILAGGGATLRIEDTRIDGNTAGYGAGILVSDAAAFELFDSQVVSNTAGSAAAIWISGTPYEVRGSTIEDNVAPGNAGVWIRAASSGTMDANLFRHNRATQNIGGAITVDASTATISANQILSNTVVDQGGAGIYASGTSLVEVRDNTIAYNVATGGAGILIGAESEALIEDNVIEHNQAVLHAGGGIAVWAGGQAAIGQNWLADNTGGGIDIQGQAAVENNFVVRSSRNGEHPSGQGQVRISSAAAVTLTNNTIADAAGEYGVEIDAADALTLTNNLVAGHAYGLYADGSATVWLVHNDVWGSTIAGYEGVAPGATDISADPDFVDSAAGDYHLGTCSGAVDAGTNADAPLVDYDGDVRPVDGHNTGVAVTDIGADERLAVTAPLPQAAFTYALAGRHLLLTNMSQNAASYAWDFGDGLGTSVVENPAYAYSRPGTYTVTLAASCTFGCESVAQDVVQIQGFSIHLPVVVRSTP